MQELVGPLQTAFSLGLQYPPLAKEALAALERWEGQQPQALSAVAPQIVPLLNPYLLDITDQGTPTDQTAAEGKLDPLFLDLVLLGSCGQSLTPGLCKSVLDERGFLFMFVKGLLAMRSYLVQEPCHNMLMQVRSDYSGLTACHQRAESSRLGCCIAEAVLPAIAHAPSALLPGVSSRVQHNMTGSLRASY